jgi:formate/nitrite transporter FocA (FNT family)
MTAGAAMDTAPEPHEIFKRTREEGRRRLERSRLELVSTALVAGFDVVFGIIALVTISATLKPHFGPEAAHTAGALGFGIAFIFIVVGRSELFTENFLVPVTALRHGSISKLKLVQLWVISPVFNIIGGSLLILVVSVHGVLPHGSAAAITKIAEDVDANSALTAFCSAIVGGAIITVMTWLVEGVGSIGGRVICAWIGGVLLTLGSFNHVIVVTLELIFGLFAGADIGALDVVQNFGIAVAGNMLGGFVFVTLTRTGQAIGSSDEEGPTEDGPPEGEPSEAR